MLGNISACRLSSYQLKTVKFYPVLSTSLCKAAIFSIIGLVYRLVGYTHSQIKNRTLQLMVLAITLILFFVSGPIKFITRYEGVFSTWFLPR